MNATFKDIVAEIILATFDRLMDFFTRGLWTQVRGSSTPNIKVKGK